MRKFIWTAFVLVFLFSTTCFAAQTYKIGVLAKRGPVKALKQWKATGDYLTAKIADKTFEIVPLDFDDVNPAIGKFIHVYHRQGEIRCLGSCNHGELQTGPAVEIIRRGHSYLCRQRRD